MSNPLDFCKFGRTEVIFADPFFASSKTCHCCGWKNDKLALKDRVFKCDKCDNKICRDLNAAKNLEKLSSGSSSRINASGDGSSSNASLISPSLNEEFNKKSRVYILKV